MAVAPALARLPLSFVENQGQIERPASYYLEGSGASVYFGSSGVTFALGKTGTEVRQEFIGARDARPVGAGRTSGIVSYFRGPRSQWRTGIPSFERIAYHGVWPGIDLVYSGADSRLEYSFLVRPGADPAAIRLAYRGASALRLNRAGELRVSAGGAGFTDGRPVAYQELHGRRVPVRASYLLDGSQYGFRLGVYDPSRPLLLDPAVFVWSGYQGSQFGGNVVAVDASGSAYLGGSVDGGDAFVAKLKPDGSGLVYTAVIGGAGGDVGTGIAVDATGAAYLAGWTTSTEATFPVTVGPDLTYNDPNCQNYCTDGFVAKLNAAGTSLEYAGYIGGSGLDQASGIAVDGAGRAYVTGNTNATESSFPVKGGPDLTENGGFDAFVARVSASGSGLEYAGYIGGSDRDDGNGIAVDASGNAYLGGFTQSSETSFPVKTGPDLSYNGLGDVFVAKVNASGAGLDYAGYIGGRNSDYNDTGRIAVDAAGAAYVVGTTTSTQTSFPVKVGPDLTFNSKSTYYSDVFVAKVDPDGISLDYAGYVGGFTEDRGYGIAVDGAGAAYVTGWTESRDFPSVDGPQTLPNGYLDAFLAKVNPSGSGFDYSGYIGGTSDDSASSVAIDGAGNAYVVGWTGSPPYSFPLLGGPSVTKGARAQAFIAKIQDIACTITGTEGNDVLTGTPGPDVICGLGGNDTLYGLGGDDILIGGAGDDVLVGGPGNDREFGGPGNDIFKESGSKPNGSDVISGGGGIWRDEVRYANRTENLTITLDGLANDGAPSERDLVAPDVLNVTGGKGNDKIIGNNAVNAFIGGPGNDVLKGRGGDDILDAKDGVTGNDTIDGGAGNDTCTADSGDTVTNCP